MLLLSMLVMLVIVFGVAVDIGVVVVDVVDVGDGTWYRGRDKVCCG